MLGVIELANTGRRTTRLGFGCSRLMGGTSRRVSLRLLEAAYESGIRHFDVAPMYGFGEAEDCLGEFISQHRADVTVTTKFGIPAGRNHRWLNAAKLLARGVLNHLPKAAEHVRKVSADPGTHISRVPFTAAEAKTSLERSLRKLRTDHIDLWLLHEPRASDLQDDGLLRFLEDAVSSGKAGSFGVGSESRHIRALQAEKPGYCRALQFEWSAFDAMLPELPPFRIHHRSLTENFRTRHQWLVSDPARLEAWSRTVDRDLRNRSALASLMLRASLDCNPGSIVLFSSGSPEHIRDNVRISEDHSLRKPALSLQALAHHESVAASHT